MTTTTLVTIILSNVYSYQQIYMVNFMIYVFINLILTINNVVVIARFK